MAKARILFNGEILKRGLIFPHTMVQRKEFIGFSDEEEIVNYVTTNVVLNGKDIAIEKVVGAPFWKEAKQ